MNSIDFIGQLEISVRREKVDTIDQKILYILSLNARISATAIAKHLHLSREIVAYRIKRLQEVNILHGFLTLINVQKIGMYSKVVGIKVQSVVYIEEVIKELQEIPEVTAIRHCGGLFDIVITITGKEINDCYNTLQHILSRRSKQIKQYQLLDKLEQHFIGLQMLVENKKERHELEKIKETKGSSFQTEFSAKKKIGGDVVIDENDRKILNILKGDARIMLSDLSTKTGISTFQLQQNIRRLITENIILGFIPYISLAHIGLQHHTVLLNVHKDVENKFRTWVEEHPYIVWRTKYLGQYNYKLTVYVQNTSHLSDILREMVTEFNDTISQVETLPVFKNVQYSTLI